MDLTKEIFDGFNTERKEYLNHLRKLIRVIHKEFGVKSGEMKLIHGLLANFHQNLIGMVVKNFPYDR